MREVNVPAAVVFSGLWPLVVEDVVDEGKRILVRVRTPGGPAACPGCGTDSARLHAYHHRTVVDVPLDSRSVVLQVRVRRLVCLTLNCCRTFREQVPGVLDRYQRRTTRMSHQVRSVVRELAGRASVRLLSEMACRLSRHTAIRALLRIPLPDRPVPKVLGVDDFALRRGQSYASVLIDAATHERIDVLPDRKSDSLRAWLCEHPGVEIIVRDGSTAYAEGARRALPEAMQASDRWHLWNGLGRVVEKAVVAHSACWAKHGPKRQQLTREQSTMERWHAIHNLLDQGVGLLDCARRLGLALNTVKRYARVPEPDRMRRPPQYRACLVDPYRDHLRARRAADPGAPVLHLFEELKALGYTGSLNLLYKYINQGRHISDRIGPSPKRLTSWIMTRPAELPAERRAHLDELLAACPEMTALARLVHEFAQIMTNRRGSELDCWMKQVREAGLPELEPFLTGLDQDHDAAVAGLTLPYSSGPIEGVNTKTKLIKRQMYGRASFQLLRHRILLA
jgi:transposase